MTDLPLWVLSLEAAGGDPLRAQEIEELVSEKWWARMMVYRREMARASEQVFTFGFEIKTQACNDQ